MKHINLQKMIKKRFKNALILEIAKDHFKKMGIETGGFGPGLAPTMPDSPFTVPNDHWTVDRTPTTRGDSNADGTPHRDKD